MPTKKRTRAKMPTIKKPARKKRLPQHKPDATTRSYVEAMSLIGASHNDICAALKLRGHANIGRRTLERYYQLELELGSTMATASVVAALYRAAIKGNVTAMIFWMKTKGGWRERDRMDDLIEAAKKDLENAPISDKEKVEIAAGIDSFLSDLETKGRSRR